VARAAFIAPRPRKKQASYEAIFAEIENVRKFSLVLGQAKKPQ
jgi:hypothetical protein